VSPAVTQATWEAGAKLYEILGMAELIRVAFQKGELMSAQERLSQLISESTKLSSAFSNINELTRIETEPAEPASDRFDIIALLNEISQAARLMAGHKPLTVMDVASPGPIVIQSNRFRIGQIMMGLMTNAVKFTNRGRVAVILSKEDNSIRLTVADTGRGMSQEQINTLFGPSDSASDVQRRPSESSALGLRIVKKMVELLGGSICVSSRLGEGTIVEVSLPLNNNTEQGARRERSE
jgi:signal transduction histidine kinase